MTVRDWMARQTSGIPVALRQEMRAMVEPDADVDDAQAGAVCLTAAARRLDDVLANRWFARANAVSLLAIDALTTLAFEHASESDTDDLADLARRSTQAFGKLAAQRV